MMMVRSTIMLKSLLLRPVFSVINHCELVANVVDVEFSEFNFRKTIVQKTWRCEIPNSCLMFFYSVWCIGGV